MSTTRPDHRVVAVRSAQTVRVRIDGRPVATSTRPVLVYETGLPVRYYLPPDDVDLTLLSPSDTRTTCPYKGEASYWSFHGGDGAAAVRTDVVWSYPDPFDSVPEIEGHLSFYDDVAEIEVTGTPPEAPAV
ncbi:MULTISPECIES: DUF427 domain-containing protein [unclassified Streptomyces]|uniref:DUF427 domain-containing protein n=1 Tax=unclassified Streptomyces TaxID=2593676 RepID=UPI001F046961|nr:MULTISPECIES: DUF427 domain-containing protein [unclassified Streptomyces]MCH0566309.1 DUF427 domain-containing protein [Streptomyces sp. MUM 2J]MCH0572981.1 DUF427 domain-containing protein [Streptomyces sp. MUM 136J]